MSKRSMDLVYYYLRPKKIGYLIKNIKEIGNKIKSMAMECIVIPMELYIKANGLMISIMEKELINFQMVLYMMAIGKTIICMG